MFSKNRSAKFALSLTAFLAAMNSTPTFAENSKIEVSEAGSIHGSKSPDGGTDYWITSSSTTLELGQRFGCLLRFNLPHPGLEMTASLMGPANLDHFRPQDGNVTFSKDGKTVATTLSVDTDRIEEGYWYTIDPIDPLGNYEMTCSVNGTTYTKMKLRVYKSEYSAKTQISVTEINTGLGTKTFSETKSQ